MSIELSPYDKCTGCLACVAACPKGAISLEEGSLGFRYPKIHSEKCVECKKCMKSCHVISKVEKNSSLQTYRYQSSDELRMQSSSGGFIPLLIQNCYSKGYYISGVIFNQDFLGATYVVTRSEDLILKMRKSKYIEADTGEVFEQIKNLLNEGEKVLFVGLPCHVAALKAFLGGKTSSNLLTVDLICHGNASPLYYEESLKSFCEKYGKSVEQIKEIDFRPKPESPGKKQFKICFQDTSVQVSLMEFPYYYGFSQRYILRESCYNCNYFSLQRCADITAGDSTFSDSDLGESIVVANTEAGLNVINTLNSGNDFKVLTETEYQVFKTRFSNKITPKLRKKILQIKQYSKLEKTYLCSTYVPLKYKIKRIFMKLRRK